LLRAWIAGAWTWLKDNNESVVALAAAVQALAIVFAVVQVWLTKKQIEDARHGVQANVEFQIQHDGRDLLNSMNPEVIGYIYENQPAKPDTERLARQKIVQVLNYYAAIFRQRDLGGIEPGFWEATNKEFCFFLTRDHVRPIWDAAVRSGNYTSAFVEVGRQCFANAARPSP
jgi:hypothetical protein